MSELRKDPVIDRWVIIASERGKRPINYKISTIPLTQNSCPFCPGNEAQTPPEIDRIKSSDGSWLLRVVPNKYPAVTGDAPQCEGTSELFQCKRGFGVHEVIIETAEHGRLMYEFQPAHIEHILRMYRSRFREIRQQKDVSYLIIFKNEGIRAGASVDHPHTQLIALPVIPQNINEELRASERHFSYSHRCIYCDIIEREKKESQRLIAENERFLAISAYAARFPFESWILPNRHMARFEELDDSDIGQLGEILTGVLKKMSQAIENFSYNFMIHSSPFHVSTEAYYHWHIKILPRTTNIAGFEWGTGYYINPVPPEEAAEKLKT